MFLVDFQCFFRFYKKCFFRIFEGVGIHSWKIFFGCSFMDSSST